MKIKPWPIKIVFTILGFLIVFVSIPLTVILVEQAKNPLTKSQAASTWAFEETFAVGVPTAPSVSLLPKTWDYISTHRTHPADPEGLEDNYGLGPGVFQADHGPACEGPLTPATAASLHTVHANQTNNSSAPEDSFYICNNHIMTSAAHSSGYDVAAMWPRQEFDFSAASSANPGIVEFDVNLTQVYPDRSYDYSSGRVWWEVVILPKDKLQIAPAREGLPIDETYSADHILFSVEGGGRRITVGKDVVGNAGECASQAVTKWSTYHTDDPALYDGGRVRRTNRFEITPTEIRWNVKNKDGVFSPSDNLVLNIGACGGLPLTRGLVMVKTHGYTPDKGGNYDKFSFHWSNFHFNGPALTPYESTFATPSFDSATRALGSTITQTVNLAKVNPNTFVAGQFNYNTENNIELSVNGGTPIKVNGHSTLTSCEHRGWTSFRIPVTGLRVGSNTLTWKVVPTSCASWAYSNNLTVKAVHVQMDSVGGTTPPPPPPGKVGDLNNDNLVNVLDLSILLSKFGTTDAAADLNKDSKVDLLDLSVLLSKWGS